MTTLLLYSQLSTRQCKAHFDHRPQLQYQIPKSLWRLSRAARPDKNLSRVLKNMNSPRQKSTVQSRGHHFVSIRTRCVQVPRSKNRRPLILEVTNPTALSCRHFSNGRRARSKDDSSDMTGGLLWFDHRPSAPPLIYWRATVFGQPEEARDDRAHHRPTPGGFFTSF